MARALASDAQVLLLDEPTAFLDLRNQARALGWVGRLTRDGLVIVFTTHDPAQAAAVASSVLMLLPESGHEQGAPERMLREPELSRLVGWPVRRAPYDEAGETAYAFGPLYTRA